MEQEYKWMLPGETLPQLAMAIHTAPQQQPRILHMAAVYYDTPDGLAQQSGNALRLRKENESSVCCMKRTVRKEGALAVREEYETEAATIAEGLQKLPSAGAPAELCAALAKADLREIARTEFVRSCYLLDLGSFQAELSVDVGRLGCGAKLRPFEELELELKSGDPAAFAAFAQELEQTYALTPQPDSKLARALAAAD